MRFMMILLLIVGFFLFPGNSSGENVTKFRERRIQIPTFCMHAIGVVKREGDLIRLDVLPQFAPALDGLAGFSHVWVLYWFHETDNPEDRATLKVHPRRDPTNPLTGVFATRAPVRPNLIGLTACRILKVAGNTIEVAGLDAKDGSPIVDLKPYIAKGDSIPEAVTPEWVKKPPPKAD